MDKFHVELHLFYRNDTGQVDIRIVVRDDNSGSDLSVGGCVRPNHQVS